MLETIVFYCRKNKTIYWRVFFDHTFDLLNQNLLGCIRFCNLSIIPYLSCFLTIRYHQKAIQLSIRSQRQKRCTIILTCLEGCFINSLEVSSFIEGASFLFTEIHKSFLTFYYRLAKLE